MIFVDKVVKKGIEYPIKDGYDKTVELEVKDGIVQMTDKSYQCVYIESDTIVNLSDDGMHSNMTVLSILNCSETDSIITFVLNEHQIKLKVKPNSFDIFHIYAVDHYFLIHPICDVEEITEEGDN